MSEGVSATPDVPAIQHTDTNQPNSGIKIATPDIIQFNESALPVDAMTNLLFEDIGGQEILNISHRDIVNGQDVMYNLVGNLKDIELRYNSKNIFSLPETIETYFKNFSIRLAIHVPEEGTGPDGQRMYILEEDSRSAGRGDLILDVTNMEKNERVDIEILKRGAVFGDTMYMEES